MESLNNLPELNTNRKKIYLPTSRYESPTPINWRRGFTFGQSKRYPLENQTGRGSPPPGSYNINSIFSQTPKGPLLRGPADETHSFKRVSNMPGPGSYNPYLPLGQNAPKISFRPKIQLSTRSKSPGPTWYYPNFKATQDTKYSGISFGIGDKHLNKKLLKIASPGPGSYEIPSIFSNTLANFSMSK